LRVIPNRFTSFPFSFGTNNFNCIVIARKSILDIDFKEMQQQLQYCFGIQDIEKIRKEKIERTNKLLKGKE